MEDFLYVEVFEENDSGSENGTPKPKSRRQSNRVWLKSQEFDSAEEAKQEVLSKNIWKIASKKNTLEGCKVEYRCSIGKYRVKECPAALYLLYHSASEKVSLFKTQYGHNHDDSTELNRGLSLEVKNFVKEKFEEGIQKPNAILAIMRQKNMVEPLKAKLVTYLKQLRHEKCGNSTARISEAEIHTWCKARTQIPDCKDELFVLNYNVCCESFDPDEQDLKIIMSTPRLLENLKYTKMVQVDATYKLIWQGYQLIIVGTSDKNQEFHPLAIAVCKGESAVDFSFIFGALQNFDLTWKPVILLADASESITQGFTKIFGKPDVRLICFFHFLKNVEKYLKKMRLSQYLKLDIYALQTCKSESTYLKASQLFLEKWSTQDDQQVIDFINYFKLQWMVKNSNWYEGVAVGYPSANPGLESMIAGIKKEDTLRERLPVGLFFNNVQALLLKWSKDRDPELPNFKNFSKVTSISLQQWTLAYQWAMSNKKVLQEVDENYKLFYVCSNSTNQSISAELLSIYKEKEGKWETFDDFKMYNYSIWTITIVHKDLNKSQCTCPYFLKHLQCKHVLGMQIRLKLVVVPNEAKLIPLGQKRKRGRPARAKKALIVQ